jgi:undecaprenyl-diphosphatase
MSWFEALILGIVQGLTEFLPVSSSGHLLIIEDLMDMQIEEPLTMTVLLHVATALATIVVLWREVAQLFKGTFTTLQWNQDKDYVAKILVGTIPVFVVGMFFKDQVEAIFGEGLLLVGICLPVTALLLALSEWLQKLRQQAGHDIRYIDAFIIGLAQACAVLPGLSRSGTTIATGLLCGVKKESVAQFSFLMVLIPILGQTVLGCKDLLLEPETLTAAENASVGFVPGLIGFVAAFVVGGLACRFMLEIVRRQRLVWFAIYCAIVGLSLVACELIEIIG